MLDSNHFGQVYALVDPITGAVRYIGCTTKALNVRLKGHLSDKDRTHKVNWIKSLKTKGVSLQIRHICFANSQEELDLLEIHHIELAKRSGIALTNTVPGGVGGRGFLHTEEAKRKISAAGKGRQHSEVTLQKLRDVKMGHPVTIETREKLRQARLGQHLSEETKLRQSKALTGRTLSTEHRKKLSQAALRRKRKDL